jgi:hypothetical protein
MAWDASVMALARCFENLALNDCVWEACFGLGLASGSDVEAVVFFTVDTGAAGSRYRGHATTAATEGQSVSVRSRTIDRVVTDAHFTQVDHAFRSKAITGFGSWRSAVSADVDHRG